MLAYIGFGVITVVNGNGALSFSSLIDLPFFFFNENGIIYFNYTWRGHVVHEYIGIIT